MENNLPIEEKDYKELYNVIVNGILYVFKDLIMDNAQNKRYKREQE